MGAALERIRALATQGFDEPARRWLIGPGGLLAACRQAVESGDEAFFDELGSTDMFDRLDEESPLAEGAKPSARAAALVGAARLALWLSHASVDGPSQVPERALAWLEDAVCGFPGTIGPGWVPPPAMGCAAEVFDPPDADPLVDRLYRNAPHPGLLALRDLLHHFLATPGTTSAPSVQVAILTSCHVEGELVNLEVSVREGPPGVSLDPLLAPFTRADGAFEAAIATAWQASGSQLGVRWAPISDRTGVALEVIGGPSVGAGAAVALYQVTHPDRAPLDPAWAFTGGIDASGSLTSLLGGEGDLTTYVSKLKAAADRTVVVPSCDHPQIVPLVASGSLRPRLLPADDLAHLAKLSQRHAAAKAAYEKAIGHAPDLSVETGGGEAADGSVDAHLVRAKAVPARHRRWASRRFRARPVVLGLAFALLVAAGSFVALFSHLALSSASSPAIYRFPPVVYANGLTLTRTWELTGTRRNRLEAALTVTNASSAPVSDWLYEVIPKSLATTASAVVSHPPPDRVVRSDPILGYYLLSLAPGEIRRFSYEVVVAVGGARASRLRAWAADQAQANDAFLTSQGSAPPASLATLVIVGSPDVIGVGRSVALHLTGTMSEGSPAPAAALAGVGWASSDEGVARVDKGTVTGVSPGRVRIAATAGPVTATATINVIGAGRGPATISGPSTAGPRPSATTPSPPASNPQSPAVGSEPPSQPPGPGAAPPPAPSSSPLPTSIPPPSSTPPPGPMGPLLVTTVAGTAAAGYSGDGGPGSQAALNSPANVAVDAQGNLYIADNGNERIRRLDHASGIITTVVGTGQAAYSGDGGPGTSAQLNNPQGMAVDPTGRSLYIADFSNERVRRLDLSTGIIETVAGNGVFGYAGDGGPAVAAELAYPVGLAVDSAGNLFIVDQRNQRVRRVDSAGIITTFAGNGQIGFSGDGGPAAAAVLNFPTGVVVDAAGDVFVSDAGNQRIRRIDAASGKITTWAGNGISGYTGDGGPATAAELSNPLFMISDASGNLLMVDQWNNSVRSIAAATDIITTLAGTGLQGFSGDGGPANQATFNLPDGIAQGPDGAIYVTDRGNNRIRRLSR